MPTTPHIIRIRRRRDTNYWSSLSHLLGITGLGLGVLLTLFVSFTITGLALGYANLTAGLPSIETLPGLLEPPGGLLSEPTRFYDRSGEHEILVLQIPGAEGKQYLRLGEEGQAGLDQALVEATIAVADPDFWKHPGFSTGGRILDQKPSLAQRLVADFLLWEEPPGLRRELRERLLAAQITSRYGREKILEWYLNYADYGNYALGADAASRAYLGKPASQLTLAEAALLASLSEAPALNPWDAPQAARERQQGALQALAHLGWIDPDQLESAAREKVSLQPSIDRLMDHAPAFAALALEQTSGRIDPERLARGGFRVITTLDFDLQGQAACAASVQVARLAGLQEELEQTDDGAPCLAARLLPTEPGSRQRSLNRISASLVLLDPRSGQVLAMVAEDEPGLNPGRSPGHSAGTLLTPFIYLTAFTRGWSPASLVWDIPSRLPAGMAGLRNPDGTFHGPQRLRMALANDYLAPAAQLLAEIGPEQVWEMARQLGLASLVSDGRLGAGEEGNWQDTFDRGEITLLEASQAYGVFANQGVLVGQQFEGSATTGDQPLQAVAVLHVSDTAGRVWLDCIDQFVRCEIHARPVVSAQLAYLVAHVLGDEPARWPSLGHPNPLEIGRPAGAKIGRTLSGQEAWTVGFTPQLVAGVWLGTSQSGEVVSADSAAGLWHAILQYASRDEPAVGWSAPAGISQVTVCDPSGMLPTEYCPAVVEEVFLNGTEPTHTDSLYRRILVNRQSGRLATIFSPPGLVEERVYMILPPEAGEWADTAGLPIPPQDYDTIELTLVGGAGASTNGLQNFGARILSPKMFAVVRGRVPITGRATLERFEYYRLQVGEGLNPLTWLQIGENEKKQVFDGQLGEWDTSGLNGLYTVQLLLVAEEQQVETATVQVTVDNQPPEVSIRFPVDGGEIAISGEEPLILQAEASDSLALASVDFILDGGSIASLSNPPFAYPWVRTMGRHKLLVRAEDLAGNTAEASIEFIVK